MLQDAGIKLTSVASRTWSKSALAMVEALIAGERDPHQLAELSKSRMRAKKDRLVDPLSGRFGPIMLSSPAKSSTTSPS